MKRHTRPALVAAMIAACASGSAAQGLAPDSVPLLVKKSWKERLHIYGYMGIAGQRNYTSLGSSHSNPVSEYPAWRLFLPKGCVWAEFDIAKGWSVGTQVSMQNEGLVDSKGEGNENTRPMNWNCSVTLEEFWIKKSFSEAANLKFGLIGTPVGRQNDMPQQFFGVIRPEDGPAFLALNNQSPSIDFSGASGDWEYEVMGIPGFTSYDFGNGYWRYGTDGIYERTINRLYAGAFRVNNSSVTGLTLGISGEFGGGDTHFEMQDNDDASTREIGTTLALASFDWEYDENNLIFRGAFQYGYLGCKDKYKTQLQDSPVRSMEAMSLGTEIGYDLLSFAKSDARKQKLYIFGRYDWSGYRDINANMSTCGTSGQRVTFGLNWYPIDVIVVKGDAGFGFNNDPSRFFCGLSVAWTPSWNI